MSKKPTKSRNAPHTRPKTKATINVKPVCERCCKQFSYKRNLRELELIHSQDQKEKVPCDICSKEFWNIRCKETEAHGEKLLQTVLYENSYNVECNAMLKLSKNCNTDNNTC